MRLNDFQTQIRDHASETDPILTLLGLGSHAGSLLEAHRRYLREDADAEVTSGLIQRHLSEVLNLVAVIAATHDLRLEEIARRNIDKIAARARSRELTVPDPLQGPVTVTEYAARAALTDEAAAGGADPYALSVPVMGLAGEVGTLLVAQKKQYRDRDGTATNKSFLTDELGDVLWYALTVAQHAHLDLDAVFQRGIDQVRWRAETARLLRELPADLPILDRESIPLEQLPRRLVFRFQEAGTTLAPSVNVTLEVAEPNHFPNGQIDHFGKPHGFEIGSTFGASLNDNSRRLDNYRYHDAIHLGFLAVMGWSPVIRGLLHLKRRSDGDVDANEDGARATFAEEGLAAILAKRAALFQGFTADSAVDDESVELLTTVLADLEVVRMPDWLWRRAISQGFQAMNRLAKGRGGFLVVDLDERLVVYSRTPPQ